VASSDEEDFVVGFLARFASMSEQERDAAVDALSPPEREALIALADARRATAEADLIAALGSGHGGLDRLRAVTEPGELLTVINLVVRERPELVVEALFAAVVLYRGWDPAEPAAIAALRERWQWHIHEQIVAAQERDRDEPADGP
jgi:hypothetical protein